MYTVGKNVNSTVWIRFIPGQGGLLEQYVSSLSGPMQFRPPYLGAGLPQVLLRDFIAMPQD